MTARASAYKAAASSRSPAARATSPSQKVATARIIASEIVPIGLVQERLATSVAIRVSTPPADRGTFERLWDVLTHHKGDRKVAFVIHERARQIRVTVDVSGVRVRPSEALVAEVEKICGAGSVSLR
mgnify:CR=1 FL=1